MKECLTNRTIHGVNWSFLDNISNQGITFLVGLVLARLLSPEEYGLIGIITIFIVLFSTIVDNGLQTALIRTKDIKNEDYNTAFISNLVLGIIMFLCLFFLSRPIANFFGREQLVSLTKMMAFILIINAFSSIQRTILTKTLDFKTQTIISLIASIGSGFIGISMAFMEYGVWSLVGQQLSRQILQSIALWAQTSWYPQMKFSVDSFKRMYSFGWRIMISGIINSLWNEAYQVVIGKYYAPGSLGQYTRAKQFADIFSSNLTGVIQRVSYPALSEIQDEDKRLKEAYRKVLKVTMLISFFCLFLLAAISKSLIFSLIGYQWEMATGFLPIICLQCVFYPLSAINLNILMVKGRSDIYLNLEIVKRGIAIIPLLLGVFVGIYCMLWASVMYGVISFLLNSYYSGNLINYTISEQIKDLMPAFTLASITSIFVFMLGVISMSPVILLTIQTLSGVSVFLLLAMLTKNSEAVFLLNIIRSRIKSICK